MAGTMYISEDFMKKLSNAFQFNLQNETYEKKDPYKDLIPIRVVFNNRSTICFWNDDSKTIVTCADGDEFSEEEGVLQCIGRKVFNGNRSAFLRLVENACRQPPKNEKKSK